MLAIYLASVATLLLHVWMERNQHYVYHAEWQAWIMVVFIILCPLLNTIAALLVLWRWSLWK